MIIHNLILSLRGLIKNKLYASIGIFGLAVGFAVCLVIGIYVNHEYSIDKCFSNYQSIYRTIKNEHSVHMNFNTIDYFKEFPEINQVCPVEYQPIWKRPVYVNNEAFYIEGIITTDNSFFELFSIPVINSLSDKPFSAKNGIVLTESSVHQIFGNKEPLGEIVTLDGSKELIVTAIVKDLPKNSSFKAGFFFNNENELVRGSHTNNGNGWFYSPEFYFQVNNNVSRINLENKINEFLKDKNLGTSKVGLQPLAEISLGGDLFGSDNGVSSLLLIRLVIAIAILVLLLSLINLVNFSISLQYSRLKNICIQKSNGAGGFHLAVSQLMNSVIWVSFAFIVSLGLVKLFISFSTSLFNRELEFISVFNPSIMIFTGIMLLFAILINSIIPVNYVLKIRFKGNTQKIGKTSKRSGLNILTTIQFASSIILLIAVIVIQQQMKYLKHRDLGFNDEYLLRIDIPRNYQKTDLLKEQVLKLPSVMQASVSSGSPGNMNYGGMAGIDDIRFHIGRLTIDEDFLKTFEVKLLQGRELRASDKNRACLLNKAAYKAYGWKSFKDKKHSGKQVVGIIDDFHVKSLHEKMGALFLINLESNPTALSVRLSAYEISETISSINGIWKEISPESPFSYHFYDEWFDAMYKKEESLALSIKTFSIIAFIITILGLFGLAFNATLQRTKEIGVRKVNGAKGSEIITMLNTDFIKWVIIAFILACPGAYYIMDEWLQNFAYKTKISLWIYVLAGAITLTIALLTVSWQSWRAAKRNPVEALRYE